MSSTPQQPPDDASDDAERTRISNRPATQLAPGLSLGGTVIAQPGEAPARRVGRYEIIDRLGEGAMATVYKAFDPGIGRALVLKFLHADLCVDAEYRMRFLREAKAAGALQHPNIVTVFDVGEIEGRPYIAMELLDGGPLSDKLQKGVGLPHMQSARIALQVAQALDYAHERGIFHRDIKPSNLLMLTDGQTIKVADFGIAHMEGHDTQEKTKMGAVIGTPQYMSPEQAMGGTVDGRSDLFSLGVMLYQLVSGQRPFEADSMVALATRIATAEPKPVTDHRKDTPPALRRIIDRLLRKQPEKRFQTGKEVAAALQKVIADLEAEADSVGKPRRIPLKIRLALGMAAMVALTMAVTSYFVTQRQYATLLEQTLDNGTSLTKMIAVESSADALSEDWVGIDVFIQEVARSLSLKALSVADPAGQVKVSARADEVGQPLAVLKGDAIDAGARRVSVMRYVDAKAGEMFVFEAPVTFQDKVVGKVRLGMSEEPLARAARQSLMLLLVLLAITVAAVAVATYVLVERYGRPLLLLKESLDEIKRGHLGYRINEVRKDEFGEVYAAFDQMAARLERDAGDLAFAGPATVVNPNADGGPAQS